MTLLFNRTAELIVFPTSVSTSATGKKTTDISGEGVRITQLDIEFSIEKSGEGNANRGSITVFNLNEKNRALLKGTVFIILEAGYEDLTEVIFKGNASKGKTTIQGSDISTTIEVGDGQTALTERNINESFKKGTKISDIILKTVDSLGLDTGVIKGLKEEVTQNGLSVSGLSKDVLTDLTKKQGLEFSVQDNEVQILPVGDDTGETAAFLSRDTGLIGSPSDREKGGIEFKSLLRPSMRPGKKVKIESRDVNGFFTLTRVVHEGNTRTGPWFSNCEAKESK